jgi:hypothetical protein
MLAKWDHDGDFGSNDGDMPNSPFDGDDGEIRYFGHTADRRERQSIAALIHRYYAAAATDNGAAACSMIAAGVLAALVEQSGRVSATSPESSGGSCAARMSEMFAHPPGRSARDLAATKVFGVRVRGREGLALLRLRDVSTRDMPVALEHGTWKVEAFFDNGLA